MDVNISKRTRIAICLATFGLLSFGLLLRVYTTTPLARAVPATLFVATDGSDALDCTSIANRCQTVQRAVDLAEDGDTVKVATGIYTDPDTGSVGYVVELTETITLQGGYDATFSDPPDPGANPTTLNADRAGRVVHVTAGAPTIQGFIITGGHGCYSGGGIVVESASPTIQYNEIVDNLADGDGGAIFVNGGKVQILNNVIISNTATWAGGLRIINDADATIVGNEIVSNTAQNSGGGIDLECCGGVTPLIARNFIAHNDGGSEGGGIRISTARALLVNNILAHNEASHGAGVHLDGMLTYPVSTTLLHNTLVDDSAGSEALWAGDYITATLVNNIVASHTTGITNTAPASSVVTADYTLFHDNGTDYGSDVTSSNEVGGVPAFMSPATGDYHVGPGSGAIDTATSTDVDEDIETDRRPIGPAPDVGADEARLRVYVPLVLKQY